MNAREIIESEVPEDFRGNTYYHGTPNEAAALEILRSGIKPQTVDVQGNARSTRAKLAPVVGRVYLTHSLRYAIVYALGGDYVGSAPILSHVPKGDGYVFAISGGQLDDIQPDEDSVGEWWAEHVVRAYSHVTAPVYRTSEGEAADDRETADNKYRIWCNIGYAMTDKQKADAMAGLYAAWASGGKRALKVLSDADKLMLLRWGAHVAHAGRPLMPEQAWKIDKARSAELARDGSNFFEIATRVK